MVDESPFHVETSSSNQLLQMNSQPNTISSSNQVNIPRTDFDQNTYWTYHEKMMSSVVQKTQESNERMIGSLMSSVVQTTKESSERMVEKMLASQEKVFSGIVSSFMTMSKEKDDVAIKRDETMANVITALSKDKDEIGLKRDASMFENFQLLSKERDSLDAKILAEKSKKAYMKTFLKLNKLKRNSEFAFGFAGPDMNFSVNKI